MSELETIVDVNYNRNIELIADLENRLREKEVEYEALTVEENKLTKELNEYESKYYEILDDLKKNYWSKQWPQN